MSKVKIFVPRARYKNKLKKIGTTSVLSFLQTNITNININGIENFIKHLNILDKWSFKILKRREFNEN